MSLLLLALILAWNASPSSEVAGYMVWWGLDPGATTHFIDAGAALSLTIPDNAFPQKVRIYFSATAYSAQGVHSAHSNEVSWIRPRGKKPS